MTGVNGLLSALAALFFWGISVSTNNAAAAAWNVAVRDAIHVFENIM